MNLTIQYLWQKIEDYKDKQENILNILSDAKLALEIAKNEEKNEDNLKELEEAITSIKELEEKTPFNNMNIYQLDEWIKELKENTYWRDNVTIGGKEINQMKIKKWCYETYNSMRYNLLSVGIIDLGIGASGKQTTEEI